MNRAQQIVDALTDAGDSFNPREYFLSRPVDLSHFGFKKLGDTPEQWSYRVPSEDVQEDVTFGVRAMENHGQPGYLLSFWLPTRALRLWHSWVDRDFFAAHAGDLVKDFELSVNHGGDSAHWMAKVFGEGVRARFIKWQRAGSTQESADFDAREYLSTTPEDIREYLKRHKFVPNPHNTDTWQAWAKWTRNHYLLVRYLWQKGGWMGQISDHDGRGGGTIYGEQDIIKALDALPDLDKPRIGCPQCHSTHTTEPNEQGMVGCFNCNTVYNPDTEGVPVDTDVNESEDFDPRDYMLSGEKLEQALEASGFRMKPHPPGQTEHAMYERIDSVNGEDGPFEQGDTMWQVTVWDKDLAILYRLDYMPDARGQAWGWKFPPTGGEQRMSHAQLQDMLSTLGESQDFDVRDYVLSTPEAFVDWMERNKFSVHTGPGAPFPVYHKGLLTVRAPRPPKNDYWHAGAHTIGPDGREQWNHIEGDEKKVWDWVMAHPEFTGITEADDAFDARDYLTHGGEASKVIDELYKDGWLQVHNSKHKAAYNILGPRSNINVYLYAWDESNAVQLHISERTAGARVAYGWMRPEQALPVVAELQKVISKGGTYDQMTAGIGEVLRTMNVGTEGYQVESEPFDAREYVTRRVPDEEELRIAGATQKGNGWEFQGRNGSTLFLVKIDPMWNMALYSAEGKRVHHWSGYLSDMLSVAQHYTQPRKHEPQGPQCPTCGEHTLELDDEDNVWFCHHCEGTFDAQMQPVAESDDFDAREYMMELPRTPFSERKVGEYFCTGDDRKVVAQKIEDAGISPGRVRLVWTKKDGYVNPSKRPSHWTHWGVGNDVSTYPPPMEFDPKQVVAESVDDFDPREYMLADQGLADLRAWLESNGFQQSKTARHESWKRSFWYHNTNARAGRRDRSDYGIWEAPDKPGVWYFQRKDTTQSRRSGVREDIVQHFEGTPADILIIAKKWVPSDRHVDLRDPMQEAVVDVDPALLDRVKKWMEKLRAEKPYLGPGEAVKWVQQQWEKDPEIQKDLAVAKEGLDPYWVPAEKRVYLPPNVILDWPIQRAVDAMGHEAVHAGQTARQGDKAGEAWASQQARYQQTGDYEKAYRGDKQEMMAHAYQIAQSVYRMVKGGKYNNRHIQAAAEQMDFYANATTETKHRTLKYVYAYLRQLQAQVGERQQHQAQQQAQDRKDMKRRVSGFTEAEELPLPTDGFDPHAYMLDADVLALEEKLIATGFKKTDEDYWTKTEQVSRFRYDHIVHKEKVDEWVYRVYLMNYKTGPGGTIDTKVRGTANQIIDALDRWEKQRSLRSWLQRTEAEDFDARAYLGSMKAYEGPPPGKEYWVLFKEGEYQRAVKLYKFSAVQRFVHDKNLERNPSLILRVRGQDDEARDYVRQVDGTYEPVGATAYKEEFVDPEAPVAESEEEENILQYSLNVPVKPFGWIGVSPATKGKRASYLNTRRYFMVDVIGDAQVFKRRSTLNQWPHLEATPVYSDPRKTGMGALDPYYKPPVYSFSRKARVPEAQEDFSARDYLSVGPFVIERVTKHSPERLFYSTVWGWTTNPEGAVQYDSTDEAQKDIDTLSLLHGDTVKIVPVHESKAEDIAKEAEKAEQPKSEEQAEAGNQKKGHVHLHGFEIAIENAKGSIRKSKNPDKPWQVTMPAHYGYIKGTVGKDKDHLDVYIGEHPTALLAFVINQKKEEGGFDEHKIMLGFESKDEAIETYDKAFNGDLGPKLRDEVFSVTIDQLKAWIEKGDTKKPFKKLDESRAEFITRVLLEADEDFDAREYVLGARYVVRYIFPPEPPVYWGSNDRWVRSPAHAQLFSMDEARRLVVHLEQQGYPTDSLTEIPASRFGLGESDQDEILDLLTRPDPPRSEDSPFMVLWWEHPEGQMPRFYHLTQDGTAWSEAHELAGVFTYKEAIAHVNRIKQKRPNMDVGWSEEHWLEPEKQRKWDAEHPSLPKPKAWTGPAPAMSPAGLPFGSYTTEGDEFDPRDYLLTEPTPDDALRQDLKQFGFKLVKPRTPDDATEIWQAKRGKVTHTVYQAGEGYAWSYSRNTVPDYNFGTGPENMMRALPRYMREAEEEFNAREYFTHERYRPKAVNIGGDLWNNERQLRNVFSWLTRIGAAPKFGTVPIHYYQQDQMKALDAIIAAAQRRGFEPEWVRYKNGKFIAHNKGKWVPIARMDYGTITPI